ncbi:conserved hypothetical protein, membrane [mine drainage metagenome]|uniref:DUF2569 domain-containing protein n=1 Tax=mine drainage metagenome TaxID=410659 RepID=T0ZAB7_9ZZZZ
MKQNVELKGMGGWLSFFVFALCILGPLLELGGLTSGFKSEEHRLAGTQLAETWHSFERLSWGVFDLTVALRWFAGFFLTKVFRPASVRLAITVLFLVPFISSIGTGVAFYHIYGEYMPGTLGGSFKGLVSAAIWATYLNRSKRVRNTYYTGVKAD